MPDGQSFRSMSLSPSLSPPLSPISVYQSQLGKTLIEDASQREAIEALDGLYHQLIERNLCEAAQVKGLYLWGDVGRGKTFLMDLFYDCLPQDGKLRLHFHRFMARIHQSLNEHSGQPNPLVSVAKALAQELGNERRVLCFDEFFVSDIGDAMLLSGLFECLFREGVVLVATSNIPIERLYENGLARHKFLPCIALLQQHINMLHLCGEQDHRLHHLDTSLSEADLGSLSTYVGVSENMNFPAVFAQLTQEVDSTQVTNTTIEICHRDIPVRKATNMKTASNVAWFDFSALCEGPRSQLDYMEIASHFKTVMISEVPHLGARVRGWIKARGTEDGVGDNQATVTGERVLSYSKNDDKARRFISLIDELYDQNVRLYLSCDVPLDELYLDGALTFEFRRTYSRLIEMSRGTSKQ
ncbi:AFG1-like ATPase [Paraglaciecola sp. T6c]|uniref:cell division protein ZapE n=1 Tax=Pseudoalteromonas atlantica (strain T6c / ATCC BAA-1087) TaxID=3042615 RepID=UPI00005C672B|nr:cell division protein ZapE [Paraglaciecola sp. T6c]ABG41216.1 AFG1-like ATPase [Paraglaciecola sp. T6c]